MRQLAHGTNREGRLCNALREFYPGALQAFSDLDSSDALAVLAVAPTPEDGRALTVSRIVRALRAGGRERFLERRARAIQEALRSAQLAGSPVLSRAYGESVRSMARIVAELNRETERLATELRIGLEQHPDAEILLSLPGLGLDRYVLTLVRDRAFSKADFYETTRGVLRVGRDLARGLARWSRRSRSSAPWRRSRSAGPTSAPRRCATP